MLSSLFQNFRFDVQTHILSRAMRALSMPRDGKIIKNQIALVFHRDYLLNFWGLESLHPFDTHRYGRIVLELIKTAACTPSDIFIPCPATDHDLLRPHTQRYLQSLADPKQVSEHLESLVVEYLSAASIEKIVTAFRLATGGTLLAADLALQCGLAINLGGGFHHAKPRLGEGFCLLADIPTAVLKLMEEGRIDRCLIIDLDAHQGNGTIACLYDYPQAYTFSMHQKDIYPSPKAVGHLDINLERETGDVEYLADLENGLSQAFEEANPEMVFFVAGADVLADDPLTSLNITRQGLVRRDQMVVNACRDRNLPLVMTLAGGYGPSAWKAQFQSIQSIISEVLSHNEGES